MSSSGNRNFIKKFVQDLLKNKTVSCFLINPVLNLHSFFYSLSGFLAVIVNNGIHPKHQIINYHQWFLDHVQEDWNIIDIGSNTGLMVSRLSKKVKYIYGIEIVEQMVREAKIKYKESNICFICADATHYDYSDFMKINCVTLSNVLEHIEDRTGFLLKLKENIP